jgi:aldose 1-epimerase
VIPPSGEQFELTLGDQRAVVVELGGGLREYTRTGLAVLDGYAVDAMCTSGRGQLLIPWPNRLRHGAYEFEGRRHQLPLTEPENGNAIHGLVRWARWNLAEREPHRIVLEHMLHPQPGYPFALSLHVEYALAPDGLSVRTGAQNVGRDACPYGAGAHPYLTLGTPVVDPLELRVPASTVLQPDEDGIASRPAPVEATEFDFRTSRPIGATKLDNAYADLERGDDGLARVELRHGDSQLAVWLDDSYRYVMVFTGDPLPDVDRRSVAVEPMTCPPNAFLTGVDVVRLEPGEELESVFGISFNPPPELRTD